MIKKSQLASMLAVTALSLAWGCAARAGDLTAEVQGVEGNKGGVMVAICTRKEYPSRCSLRERASAHDGVVTVLFRGVAAGQYAAMIFHDENNNGALDTDPSGIPVEGVGFSQNPRGLRGLPTFDQIAFDVTDSNSKVAIRVRY